MLLDFATLMVVYLSIPVAALSCRSVSAFQLRLWVLIPPGIWISVCCVLSGRGLCDELITRPEESYRLWCVVVCDLETSWMRRPWPTADCCAKRKKERNGSLFGEGNKLESSSLCNVISFWGTSQINTSASYFNVTRHGPLPALILYVRCKILGLKLSLYLQAWIYHLTAGRVTLLFFCRHRSVYL